MPPWACCFNEAAGFTRRKHVAGDSHTGHRSGFNEAAGFTRRKRRCRRAGSTVGPGSSMRPPDLPGGNESRDAGIAVKTIGASMRPPDLPGGNSPSRAALNRPWGRFNEAAGFTRRKPAPVDRRAGAAPTAASMRPPDLPGGNCKWLCATQAAGIAGFNEAAGFTRRKLVRPPPLFEPALAASMRPPDLPGGNHGSVAPVAALLADASMRPPDLPGGNAPPGLP